MAGFKDYLRMSMGWGASPSIAADDLEGIGNVTCSATGDATKLVFKDGEGEANASCTAQGTLTKFNIVDIAGVGNISSSGSGTAGKITYKSCSGIADAESDATGVIEIVKFKMLAGVGNITSSATSLLSKYLRKNVSGTGSILTTATGEAEKKEFNFVNLAGVGNIDSSASGQASKKIYKNLAGIGNVDCIAFGNANKLTFRFVEGEGNIACNATGNATKIKFKFVTGIANISSSATGSIIRAKIVSGIANVSSSATGTLIVVEREQQLAAQCGVTVPVLRFGVRVALASSVLINFGVKDTFLAPFRFGVGLDIPGPVVNPIAAYMGGGILLVDWEVPITGIVDYYEIKLATSLTGQYSSYGVDRFTETQGFLNNIPNTISPIYLQIRAVSPRGLAGPWTQVKKGLLIKPTVDLECSAIVGSIIPEGARFSVRQSGGRLAGFQAMEEILF